MNRIPQQGFAIPDHVAQERQAALMRTAEANTIFVQLYTACVASLAGAAPRGDPQTIAKMAAAQAVEAMGLLAGGALLPHLTIVPLTKDGNGNAPSFTA